MKRIGWTFIMSVAQSAEPEPVEFSWSKLGIVVSTRTLGSSMS